MPTLDQHRVWQETGQPPITLRHVTVNLESLCDLFDGDRQTQLREVLAHVRSVPLLWRLAEQLEAQTVARPDQMRLLT